MQFNLEKYKTFIFDCDGVILNSNFIKGKCFYLSTLEFGEEVATYFIKYHSKAGGISRSAKYDYFIKNILPKFNIKLIDKKDFKTKLISKYEELLHSYIYNSELSPYLDILKSRYKNANWMMISGAEQNELRKILQHKGIDHLFNNGIYGSPLTKDMLIERKINSNNIKFPAIFFGDSKLDFYAASNFDIDFIFLYEWTDLSDWQVFCESNKISYSKNLFTAALQDY